MPDSQAPSSSSLLMPGEQGQHYAFIRQAIAPCLVQSSPQRRSALKQTPVQIPAWYAAATDAQKDRLKALMQARCESLNALEKTLGKLQTVHAFCQPLLEKALQEAGYPLDVNRTWLRLYSPAEDGFGVSTEGFKVKTFSLLQGALNNFSAQEAESGFFNAASGFINEPDTLGHFERHATTLKIEVFVKLCRDLDLGARYQAHLKSTLYPDQGVAEGVLRERYLRYQKDAFLAAAYLALLKGDIGDSDHGLLLKVAAGQSPIRVGDKQIWYRTPCLMNLHLNDCLIIDPCVKYHYSDWFIAYIPDDPDHPIKRYASFDEFERAMTRRLMAGSSRDTSGTDYAHFFSRFVAYKDRPYYFRRLTELVLDAPPQPFAMQWLRSEWGRVALSLVAPRLSPIESILGEPQPYRRDPLKDPRFNINADAINGPWDEVDLWPQRFESLRKRMLDDGLAQAIPTADADAASRSLRLAHYLNIGLFAVNLVAMAVPPLGAVMSVVMVGQMLYEVLEGVVELSAGDREAGWAHISDVLESLAQVAVGAAVFHVAASPFIENLKSVQLPSGKTRLWKPDLSAYEHVGPLPVVSVLDEQGLVRVGSKRYLTLDDRRYAVGQDPVTQRYHLEHPTRPDAYRPRLVANGSGAWNHELEQPLTWQGATLMRRLGPVVEGFSDATLEQIRQVSDISEAKLRRVHVEGEPVPAILLDTIRQFRAYDGAVKVAQGIGDGALPETLCGYAAVLAVELPGWPDGKAIEVFADETLSGPSAKYGSLDASVRDTLQIRRAELMAGKLPERIHGFLDEAQMDRLVGRYTSREAGARIGAVQKALQERAILARERLMRSLYTEQQPLTDTAVALIQRNFKSLPTLMVRELLAEVAPAQREALTSAARVPLHLAERARVLQQRVRLVHAYEGLYLEGLANPDTEALVLNSLENLPGWTEPLRLEVREGEFEGALRASYGAQDAAERKVLVHKAPGRYQAFDGRGQALHGVNGLFGALQHALPDAHRNAIGLPHVGQGEQLKGLILEKALPRQNLRRVLGMQPERKPFFRWPWRLSDNRLGYPLSGRGTVTWRRLIEERVRSLYPSMNPAQLSEYLQGRNLEDDRWLKALETEYKQLESTLSRWLVEGPRDRATLRVRRRIYDTLRDVWRKSAEWDTDISGNYRGQRIRLEDPALGAQLATLPALPGNFDHVSSVYLPGCGLTDQSIAFLSSFRALRTLNLENNALTRLPDVCANMPRIEGLELSDNAIVLTSETALHIRAMHRIEGLALQGNPLSRNIDISRMPRLTWLYLSGSGLRDWPVGLFAFHRPRQFLLDLSGNHLSSIPDVAPGSDRARILARTVVTRDWLTPQVRSTLSLYVESVGLDPARRFPPRGVQDSAHWMSGMTQQQWLSKQPIWNDLEEAIGSEAFFDEIRKLSVSSDMFHPDYKIDLTAKVWRMLEAMASDTALRERLFEMATAPTTCVDAGAQLFNAMGIEVMLREAQDLPDAGLIALEMLELAKGKARLDELGRIAHARVGELLAQGRRFPQYDAMGDLVQQYDDQGNAVRSIDEVEVHLAYATGLADRLDLPWQSKSMRFEEPDVTSKMLDAAYTRVIALERGNLLREGIIEQPFWADYVQVNFPREFDAVSAKNEALINLYSAQQELAGDGGLTALEKADLRATIDTSAQILGKSSSQATPEQVMSDDEYFADMASLGEEHKNVLRSVTDRVMGRSSQNRK